MYSKSVALCFLLFIGCQNKALDQQSRSSVVKEKGATAMRTHEIESWGNRAPALQIDLPDGYNIKKQKGPDFDVHYMSQMVPKGVKKEAEMGIYIGHHPDYSEKDKGVVGQLGDVGQQKVRWMCWETDQQGDKVYHCETLVKGFYDQAGSNKGVGVKELLLHIFISGTNADRVKALREAAKTLRVKQ